MAKRIQHQRTSVSGNVPDLSDVMVGEIIVNFADRTLRTKNGSGAIIRVNQNIPVTDVAVDDPVSGDMYLTTSGQIMAYFNNGSGLDWYDVAPPEDLSGYLAKAGGTMTGQITLPGGGAGLQAIAVSETAALIAAAVADYVAKAGGTMTGQLTLPGGGSGFQALTSDEIETLIAAAVPPDLSNVLLKTGGVMTGQITLPGGSTGNQAASANELSAAIAAHAAQPDPHTAYTLTTEFDAGMALKAPLASPTFTGVPAAPTAAPGTDTTQVATTAFVAAIAALKANLASPTFTGTPAAPTAAPGTDTTQLATTAFAKAAVDAAIAALSFGTLSALNTTTGGNAINFGSIPAGTKRISLNFNGLSSNGSNDVLFELGDAGGIETSGYSAISNNTDETSAGSASLSFPNRICENRGGGSCTYSGRIVFEHLGGNTWTYEGVGLSRDGASREMVHVFGSKALSAELTQVQLKLDGANTFDVNGGVSIIYD